MAKTPKMIVEIAADLTGLRKGTRDASKELGGFKGKVTQLGKSLASGFAVAAAAAAAFAATLAVDGVKAAIEDVKAQRLLATQLKKTTKATDEQVASVESWVEQTALAYGIADDKLRPALARVVRSTKDASRAQDILNLALDVSAGTGKDFDTVVNALSKAYDGSNTALARLGTGISKTDLATQSFDQTFNSLKTSFSGFAAEEANTIEGKLARMNLAWDEAQETIGMALLPAMEDLTEWATSEEGQAVISDFAEGFSEAIQIAADYMPDIVKEAGKLAGKVDKIDWEEIFGGAKLAAAVAIGMKVPGPIQVKLLAIAAAYYAGDSLLIGDGHGVSDWKQQGKDLQDMFYGRSQVQIDAGKQSVWDVANRLGNSASSARPNIGGNTIIINGAIDPNATARLIAQVTAQNARMGGTGTAGIGVG